MLISLNWLRDFVDVPQDLDPGDLAERFTCTTAEVEGVQHITCSASGLIAAGIVNVEAIPGDKPLFLVKVDLGNKQVDTVTIAEGLKSGDRVVFAPPGSTLPGVGQVAERKTAGRTSAGMIVPGDALSLPTVGQRAMWLPPSTRPGSPVDMSLFDDWVIEVDNKSITHRPDLWGHYGIAREVAAICDRRLKPYPIVPPQELDDPALPAIPIVIDDPSKCPRYSALRFTGVRPQPAPLWMQVRLAHVGLRPIDILVDLTNYIMAELGQPMHAFDCANIDRIEVALAKPGEKFVTLDGFTRTMPEGALMIQCNRQSVALAGIMGGANTEVTAKTTDLLLESANFEAATIRRCATALGHRTDASARFEKSQDPHNTVIGIGRFVYLARPELPDMKFTSRLSDCFPNPPKPITIRVDPAFVGRYIGRQVPADRIMSILAKIGFAVKPVDGMLEVGVPTWRATKDVSIEADIIEEVARFIGYGTITPALPEVTVRYAEPEAITRLERQTLTLMCGGMSYAEVHRYIWFDAEWLKLLGFDPGPTLSLKNPVAAGTERLRTTLLPGLLAAVDLNRRHFERFELLEIGSALPYGEKEAPEKTEQRHLALAVVAPGRKPAHEDALILRLKSDLETFAQQVLKGHFQFAAEKAAAPWEHPAKTAAVKLDGLLVGRITAVPAALRRRIDEHLVAWSIALAEINLSLLAERRPEPRKLAPVPVYPRINLDFSVLARSSRRYEDIEGALRTYDHPLLRRLAFVDSYEGGSVPQGMRSFTFRATIGDPSRTLTEQDIQDFRSTFLEWMKSQDLALRT
ncbi:MAG TPA: phenylalanine--tRNA ligase subunit beta [Phycisphaerae bacterium]|nr:phenylalanine--tRNA ligase subunit beta [Phycisphaerae bacterium]HRR84908.1 phenylalanine--tRNA ligase subunit beta [Phycisphaerae bacterium]